MSRQLVTLKQALEQRQWLTEPWLRRRVHERRIPYFKVDGILLFDLDDLDAYAERGRVEPPSAVVTPMRRRRAS